MTSLITHHSLPAEPRVLLADNLSPTGWCLKHGMRFTSHHDAPVAFANSMHVLGATVTRRSRSGDIIGLTQPVSGS